MKNTKSKKISLKSILLSTPAAVKPKNEHWFQVLNYLFPSAFMLHAVFLGFFYFVNIEPMVYFNMGSMLLFVVVFYLNRRARHYMALALAIAEVLIHAAFCVHYMGWNAGWQYYCFVVAILPFLAPRGVTRLKLVECLPIFLMFVAMDVYARNLEPSHALSPNLELIVNFVNILGSFFLICTGAFYFSYTAERRYEEISELKDKQDGDYLLTSMILKPLQGVFGRSSNVAADFLINQYKKFSFRQREGEIGGDLCVVDTIRLNSRDYTVFLNADAMGKSLQGAGGALVLGTAFKAIISATHNSPAERKKRPENWLKDAFENFQNIFVSFNESMLASAFFGIVHDQTGLLYYINAEHPWPLLYRGEKAEFLDNRIHARKLGTTSIDFNIEVGAFQLEQDDQLIMGSDGRDDIQLGLDSRGGRQINNDENAFLALTENCKGNLKRINAELHTKGELIDDLSLMKIHFTGSGVSRNTISPETKELFRKARNFFKSNQLERSIQVLEAALPNSENHAEILSMLSRYLVRSGEYERATVYMEELCDVRPGVAEDLFLASALNRKKKNMKKARSFGESCRILAPKHVKNLLNLVAIYVSEGDYALAEVVLKDILEKDPENTKALLYAERLSARLTPA